MRPALPVFLFGWLALLPAVGQSGLSTPVSDSSPETALFDLIANEAKTGTWVFYNQAFVDVKNRKVSYSGSVYGAIKSIKLNECVVDIDAEVVDLFSGIAGKRQVSQQQDSTSYSYSFSLTTEIADTSEVIEARPFQLRRTTHSICADNSSCNFTWLRLTAGQPVFQMKVVTNDLLEFQGKTRQIMLPLCSAEAGHRLVTHLRDLAAARCR